MDYRDLFNKYEKKGIPYRGIRDEIKRILLVVISHMSSNDIKINNVLCESFSIYRFIQSISIYENLCVIKFYDGDELKEIQFNCFYFGDDYSNMLYSTYDLIESGASVDKVKKLSGTYKLSGICHKATLDFLEAYKDKNYKAVTSLCVTNSGYSFFHSYIWDVDANKVFDLSRNIVMNKDDFDYLFVLSEINVIDYSEYLSSISSIKNDSICHLLALSLNKLCEKNFVKEKSLL